MKIFTLSVVVLASALALAACAGECTWGDEEVYFRILAGETIENMSEVDRAYYTPSQCFYCLGVPRQRYLRWGVAGEKATLFSMRELDHRDRLIKQAEAYLPDQDAQLAAATVLAYQGVREANGFIVFEILVQHESRVRQLWYTLAALQDPRTVGYAEKRYSEIRSESETIDTRTRQRLSDIVDCLFHLNESSKVLSKIAEQESDSGLVEYIRSVHGG